MRSDSGRADKGHRLDVRVIAESVHDVLATVDDVENPFRNASLQGQFHQPHGHHRVLLGGFEHEGVAGGDGHRKHPQRNHRREVERCDAGADAERLQQRIGVYAASHVGGQLTHLQAADIGGVLDHLKPRKMSPSASGKVFPCSAVRIAASSCMFSRMSC